MWDFFFYWVLPPLILVIFFAPLVMMILYWVREGDAFKVAISQRRMAIELTHWLVSLLEEQDRSVTKGGMDLAKETLSKFKHPDHRLDWMRKRIRARHLDDLTPGDLKRCIAAEEELLERIHKIPFTRAMRNEQLS